MSTDGNLSIDDDTDGTDDPAEVEADSSNNQIKSQTADRGTDIPTLPTSCPHDHDQVRQAKIQASNPKNPTDVQIQLRKMTLQQNVCSP